ncbi:Bsp6I family type II restriction endonuclease [Mycoplasmopsis bovis]|uniref:Bsp6I family type II restriction endonuclease n=2 Tax=Mycoplasmopsis bovis TaxID=28903 RepID=UPI0012603E49|nr:Bsp6I family type II restriction endonuclease [Mycoplasmopsis bovis]MBT1315970.1 Bsp6I family restriction endonuclease [Mycoplasmopsis bovis]MBT1367536.1 Bsp6I family restriction endonuclease [Mycoplasmopsis bovis]MBT1368870.1 Bsp6I family restriction endonuclease [Mycoplasmopsis bovis]MBT1421013.1 Bsp6I family restriction endonuclease [Mycoplasmopsis bovis]MCA8840923.1 Bsp6I family type II restriction endonuclease [Mycoplasmopsis bovis]
MNVSKVTKDRYTKIIDLYPVWKYLTNHIKNIYTRGVNFHESFSEIIVCYVNDYYLSSGNGSEDALTNDFKKVQIKATSNWNLDITSFGPKSEFDILEFARLDQTNDLLYLYKIPIDDLKMINVNSNNTFEKFQKDGKRPRLSIIKNYIEKYSIKHYAVVSLQTGDIIKSDIA